MGPFPRRRHGASVVVACCSAGLLAMGPAGRAATPQSAPPGTSTPASDIEGRWELRYEAPAAGGQRGAAGGRRGGAAGRGSPGGRGAGAPAGPTRIVLDLTPGPANTLTGTVTIRGSAGLISGRAGAGSQPVEISDGRFDGSRVSFEVWALDNYHNCTRYEGQLDADTLRLTVSRETADGVETIAEGTAPRLPY